MAVGETAFFFACRTAGWIKKS